MAEYIERETLINELSASCMPIDDREISGLFDCDESIRDIIDAMPAADVRPERYSHWHEYLTNVFMGRFSKDGEPICQDRKTFMCVKCGRGSAIKEKFCPSCGAKMDGKDGDTGGE